jgi:hypothetical protein
VRASSTVPIVLAYYYVDVDCVRLSGKSGDVFSFKTFDASMDGHGVAYVNDVVSGHYADFPYGPGMDKYSP